MNGNEKKVEEKEPTRCKWSVHSSYVSKCEIRPENQNSCCSRCARTLLYCVCSYSLPLASNLLGFYCVQAAMNTCIFSFFSALHPRWLSSLSSTFVNPPFCCFTFLLLMVKQQAYIDANTVAHNLTHSLVWDNVLDRHYLLLFWHNHLRPFKSSRARRTYSLSTWYSTRTSKSVWLGYCLDRHWYELPSIIISPSQIWQLSFQSRFFAQLVFKNAKLK